jgi:hypothetical protein
MKRPALLIGLVSALIGGSVLGQNPIAEFGGVDPSRGSAAEMRSAANSAVNTLQRRVESVEWEEVPFEDVLEWLRDLGQDQVNIIVRWGPLGVENVSQESLVSLKLYNTRVADVLNEVFDYLSEDGQIQFQAYGNMLRISTRQDFGRKLYTRVYDTTDLLFRVPNFGQSAPQIDLQQVGGQGGGGGGGGGQSVFSGGQGGGQDQEESGEQAEQRLEQELTKLKEAIEQIVAPETWDVNGGKGRIRVVKNSLVVVNTIEIHEQIAGEFSFSD